MLESMSVWNLLLMLVLFLLAGMFVSIFVALRNEGAKGIYLVLATLLLFFALMPYTMWYNEKFAVEYCKSRIFLIAPFAFIFLSIRGILLSFVDFPIELPKLVNAISGKIAEPTSDIEEETISEKFEKLKSGLIMRRD